VLHWPVECCEFRLFPERHFQVRLGARVLRGSVWDPAREYPPPTDTRPVLRPVVARTRPPPIEFRSDIEEDFENPDVLALESPSTKLVRWILTCPHGAAYSRDLHRFLFSYHAAAVRGWRDGGGSSFRFSFPKCADITTGFHLVSPREEVWVLESRRREAATRSLEGFLRALPQDAHIIANTNVTFSAPRLYCCFDSLVKTISIPVSVDELGRIRGLYCHDTEAHRLFSVATKLGLLIGCEGLSASDELWPTYTELRLLMRKANGLLAMPINDWPVTAVKAVPADFGQREQKPFLMATDLAYVPVGGAAKAEEARASALTNFVLTRPLPRKRGASVGRADAAPRAPAGPQGQSARRGGDRRQI
jgi:hypothetical protein